MRDGQRTLDAFGYFAYRLVKLSHIDFLAIRDMPQEFLARRVDADGDTTIDSNINFRARVH